MQYNDIKNKQVINVCNGSLIGYVVDLQFQPNSYEIEAIYVEPKKTILKRLFPCFFPCEYIKIYVREIENIQGYVILVRYDE